MQSKRPLRREGDVVARKVHPEKAVVLLKSRQRIPTLLPVVEPLVEEILDAPPTGQPYRLCQECIIGRQSRTEIFDRICMIAAVRLSQTTLRYPTISPQEYAARYVLRAA